MQGVNVFENGIPIAKHVFSTTISDKEEKPAVKAQKLYYLSEESTRKHEIEDYYDKKFALSGTNLAEYILSDDVLNKLRIALKNGTGQKLTNHEVALAMVEHLFAEELVTEDIYKRLSKIKKEGK